MPGPRGDHSARPPSLDDVPLSDLLRALAALGEPRFFARGRTLIREGEAGQSLYIILSGRLRAFSEDEFGQRRVVYGEYLPGEFLGEMSLDGGVRSATVTAIEAAWCVHVTRPTLERHLAAHPAFAFELLAKVIRRARSATLSMRAIALNDVYGRIAWLLNSRAVPGPGDTRVLPQRLTHQALADQLGCTRPMVSRVMKELATGGYLVDEGDELRLLKPLPQRF